MSSGSCRFYVPYISHRGIRQLPMFVFNFDLLQSDALKRRCCLLPYMHSPFTPRPKRFKINDMKATRRAEILLSLTIKTAKRSQY